MITLRLRAIGILAGAMTLAGGTAFAQAPPQEHEQHRPADEALRTWLGWHIHDALGRARARGAAGHEDPGWYKHPPGTVAEAVAGQERA